MWTLLAGFDRPLPWKGSKARLLVRLLGCPVTCKPAIILNLNCPWKRAITSCPERSNRLCASEGKSNMEQCWSDSTRLHPDL